MQLRTASSVAEFKVYAGADYVCVAVRMAGLGVLESALGLDVIPAALNSSSLLLSHGGSRVTALMI